MQQDKTIISLLVGLVLFSAFFFVIERVLGRGRAQPVFRQGWFTDFLYWMATPLTKTLVKYVFLIPLVLLVVAKVATAEGLKTQTYAGFGSLAAQPLWLQAVEIYILVDFIGYWTHRLFHGPRGWPFHAVHHSSEDLDWLGSVRVHPVNELINNSFQAAPLILLGFNPWVTLSTAPFLTFYAIFLHANVNWDFGPLRSVIATPVFHRWHHSKDREAWDKNFAGLFPLWDILFGTYYMPKGRYPENFGIHDDMPKGFFGQLWRPFVWKRGEAAAPVES